MFSTKGLFISLTISAFPIPWLLFILNVTSILYLKLYLLFMYRWISGKKWHHCSQYFVFLSVDTPFFFSSVSIFSHCQFTFSHLLCLQLSIIVLLILIYSTRFLGFIHSRIFIRSSISIFIHLYISCIAFPEMNLTVFNIAFFQGFHVEFLPNPKTVLEI